MDSIENTTYADTLAALASVKAERGEFLQAERLFARAREIHERIHGKDDPRYGECDRTYELCSVNFSQRNKILSDMVRVWAADRSIVSFVSQSGFPPALAQRLARLPPPLNALATTRVDATMQNRLLATLSKALAVGGWAMTKSIKGGYKQGRMLFLVMLTLGEIEGGEVFLEGLEAVGIPTWKSDPGLARLRVSYPTVDLFFEGSPGGCTATAGKVPGAAGEGGSGRKGRNGGRSGKRGKQKRQKGAATGVASDAKSTVVTSAGNGAGSRGPVHAVTTELAGYGQSSDKPREYPLDRTAWVDGFELLSQMPQLEGKVDI